MKPEHSAILDDLLSKWHWSNSRKVLVPEKRCAAGFENYRASRQHHIEDVEDDTEKRRIREVGFAAESMEHPHKAAIYEVARNLCTGWCVWKSPRLPDSAEQRDQIVQEARAIICTKLRSAGVI